MLVPTLCQVSREGLNLKIDAGDLCCAGFSPMHCALTKIGEETVCLRAQFQSCADEDAIDFQAVTALKFEKQRQLALLICAATEDPAAGSENCAGEVLSKGAWLLSGKSLHFHGPGDHRKRRKIPGWHLLNHTNPIGLCAPSLEDFARWCCE